MLMLCSARGWQSLPSVPGRSSKRIVNSLLVGMVGTSLRCTSGMGWKGPARSNVLTLANASSLGIPNPTPQQIGREVFRPGRLNPQFDDIYQLQNSAESPYNGGSLTLSRRMNEELEFSASYTLSKTFDNASDYDEQPE